MNNESPGLATGLGGRACLLGCTNVVLREGPASGSATSSLIAGGGLLSPSSPALRLRIEGSSDTSVAPLVDTGMDDIPFEAFSGSLFGVATSFRLSSAGVRIGPDIGGAAFAAVDARGFGAGTGTGAADWGGAVNVAGET